MAIQLQVRRGTTEQNANFVGAAGEITLDTDTFNLYIHNGTNPGGIRLPTLVAEQRATAKNPTWYRRRSDGYVEAGGIYNCPEIPANKHTTVNIALPLAMSVINASVDQNKTGGTGFALLKTCTPTITNTQLTCLIFNSNSVTSATTTFFWKVSGYAV